MLMLLAVVGNSLTHIAALSGHALDTGWTPHQHLHAFRHMALGIGLALVCPYTLFGLFRRGESTGRAAMAAAAFLPIFAPWMGFALFGFGDSGSSETAGRIDTRAAPCRNCSAN